MARELAREVGRRWQAVAGRRSPRRRQLPWMLRPRWTLPGQLGSKACSAWLACLPRVASPGRPAQESIEKPMVSCASGEQFTPDDFLTSTTCACCWPPVLHFLQGGCAVEAAGGPAAGLRGVCPRYSCGPAIVLHVAPGSRMACLPARSVLTYLPFLRALACGVLRRAVSCCTTLRHSVHV